MAEKRPWRVLYVWLVVGLALAILMILAYTAYGLTGTVLAFTPILIASYAVHKYVQGEEMNRLLEQRADQLAQILQISETLRTDLDLELLLARIVQAVQESLDFNLVLLSLVDPNSPDYLRRVACAGLSPEEFARLKATLVPREQYARIMRPEFRLGRAYFFDHRYVDSVALWDRQVPVHLSDLGPRAKGGWHADDIFFVPLIGTDGDLLGIVSVDDPVDRRLPTLEVAEALELFANQATIAIENSRLFQERERRITELAILNEIGQSLSSTLNLDELLEAVHQQVSRPFDATNFYIVTYEEGADEWTFAFQLEHGQRQPVVRHKVEAGLTGYIIRNRMPVLLRSTEEANAFDETQGIPLLGEQAKSWLGVPLLAADKVVGVMAIQGYEQENLYDEQDLALFSTIAAQVAIAIANARLYEQRVTDLAVLRDQRGDHDRFVDRDRPIDRAEGQRVGSSRL